MRILILILTAVLVLTGVSSANMRAPMHRDMPPTSGLLAAGKGLSVISEELSFDCIDDGCMVSALYKIKVKEKGSFKMSFIGHTRPPVIASVNDNDSEVSVKEIASDSKNGTLLFAKPFEYEIQRHWDEGTCNGKPDLSAGEGWEKYLRCLLFDNSLHMDFNDPSSMYPWALYSHEFNADMAEGENTVHVIYFQLYSRGEPLHTRRNNPFRFISYELWPLQEWILEPGFRINVNINLKTKGYGLFGHKKHVVKMTAGEFKKADSSSLLWTSKPLPISPVNSGKKGSLDYNMDFFHRNFPDRIYIKVGRENQFLDDIFQYNNDKIPEAE